MDERLVKFFHRTLPVCGDAKIISFEDGDYRFWEVRSAKGERCLVFREMVGTVTIQERIDYYVRHESQFGGLGMIFADHIVPASMEAIRAWAQSHRKQMKKFDLEKAMNADADG